MRDNGKKANCDELKEKYYKNINIILCVFFYIEILLINIKCMTFDFSLRLRF